MNALQRNDVGHVTLLVGFLLLCSVASVNALLTTNEQQALAQRFRPYLKTSAGENEWLCNWEWFVGHSWLVTNYHHQEAGTLRYGTGDPWYDCWPVDTGWVDDNGDEVYTQACAYIIATPDQLEAHSNLLISLPFSDVSGVTAGVPNGSVDLKYAMHIDEAYRCGETNNNGAAIYAGHGIYAHVEEVPNRSYVNIEYYMLWAYNWASYDYHSGDLTSIIVEYDTSCDLLTRVTYLAHGAVIMSFRLVQPESGFQYVSLPGTDWNGNPLFVNCMQLRVGAGLYSDGPHYMEECYEENQSLYSWDWNESEPQVYMVQDPVTLRYEHPVVYAERTGHESWPNSTGSLGIETIDGTDLGQANSHDGSGVSFLTTNVQVLGTLSEPTPGCEPFLFYNGKFGNDSAGIIFHKGWYWPEGRDNNSYGITNRWADADPYVTLYSYYLNWPPNPEYRPFYGPYTFYVNSQAQPPYQGTSTQPFPDLLSAYSFVPKGGTLSMAAGMYHTTAPGALSRACTITATGGPVTILP